MKILVASSDPGTRAVLADILGRCGMKPLVAANVEEARAALVRAPIDLVFCDQELPGGGFRQVLQLTKASGTKVPLVVSSLLDDLEKYLEAMQMGAYDFIAPPYRNAEVESIVSSVRRARQPISRKENRSGRTGFSTSGNDKVVA